MFPNIGQNAPVNPPQNLVQVPPPQNGAVFPVLPGGGIVPAPMIGNAPVQNPINTVQNQIVIPLPVNQPVNQSEQNALTAILNLLAPALGAQNGNQLANALLCGAHVIFPNQTLNELLGNQQNPIVVGNLQPRTSSHYRGPVLGIPPYANNPHQYGINIMIGQPPQQAHLLFGSTAVPHNANGPLFLQLENAGVGGIGQIITHGFNFVTHVITGNQVGPFGQCGYNDHNPIQING